MMVLIVVGLTDLRQAWICCCSDFGLCYHPCHWNLDGSPLKNFVKNINRIMTETTRNEQDLFSSRDSCESNSTVQGCI